MSLDKLDEWPNAARRMLQMKPTIIDATNNSIAYYASFSYAYKREICDECYYSWRRFK